MNEFIEFSKELAIASGVIIRKYFRTELLVDPKVDNTPVTIADREAELIMRRMIRDRFPGHGILGEEFETINPDADFQWILDPIDGTKNFLSGTCLFGTLITLMNKGKPIIGVINNPILDQFLIGNGNSTWLNGEQVCVRDCESLSDAILLTTSHWSISRYRNGNAFEELSRKVKMYRTWGDCYGYYLIATGYADIMIDPAMHIWDVAPLIPIIEGAGGRLTDYYGNDPLDGEGSIASAGKLHDEVIRLLNPEI
jgi:myo-inositol-1(or 4)-monophosphatase